MDSRWLAQVEWFAGEVPLSRLKPYDKNPRRISKDHFERLKKRIGEEGFRVPVCVDQNYTILAGHQRVRAAKELGITDIPVMVPSRDLTDKERAQIVVADNVSHGETDFDILSSITELSPVEIVELGVDIPDIVVEVEEPKGSMTDQFGVPPFSVLDTKQGYWQDRKRFWLSLGIKSEIGRGDDLAYGKADGDDITSQRIAQAGGGTSIFDPVLCELAYKWFSAEGAIVLDPFAGGSVRGIVASKCNRQYVGIDLRKEQVDENQAQAVQICQDPLPVWHTGDSTNLPKLCKGLEADFIFTCPPYGDLEVYSDDPADLSTMAYNDFKAVYHDIIAKACATLKDNRFACIVVGDFRDEKGNYRNFVSDTIEGFHKAGLALYNEAILCTAIGSLPLRAGKTFKASRKLGKAHQNVLVFVKGDAKLATEYCGDIVVTEGESDDA